MMRVISLFCSFIYHICSVYKLMLSRNADTCEVKYHDIILLPHKKRRCGMIANETNLHTRPK